MKLVFAGAESTEMLRTLKSVGAKNFLCSYLYMRKMSDQKVEEILKELHEVEGMFLMLDSGAHTFYEMNKRGNKPTPEQCFEFVEEYTEWLKVWGEYFDIYIELDVASLVGIDHVESWRKYMRDQGLKPVPVYHKNFDRSNKPTSLKEQYENRIREWKSMLEDCHYAAIGDQTWEVGELQELLKISDRMKVPVHGFAMTKRDVFLDTTFYSVDSTSWLMGGKFGTTYIFDGKDLRTKDMDNKDVRKHYKDHCEKYGIDYEQLLKDDYRAVNAFNASMWVLYQEHVIDPLHKNDPLVVELDGRKTEASVPRPKVRVKDEDADFGYNCDQCYIGNKCPYFEGGSTCSIPFMKGALKKQGEAKGVFSVEKALNSVLEATYERLQFALVSERAKGGMINPDISKEIDRFVNICSKVQDILNPQDTIKVEAKGSGIISQIFGGYGKGGGKKPSEFGEEKRFDMIEQGGNHELDVIDAEYENVEIERERFDGRED